MTNSMNATWWQILIGIGVTLILGHLIKYLLSGIESEFKSNYPDNTLPAPPGFTAEIWEREVLKRTPGGHWLGRFEQIIFFGSFITSQWPIAASWLAFKLASKWNAWTTTWQSVKPEAKDTEQLRYEYARAHFARAAIDHRLFILGTAANIVVGLVGFAIAIALPTFASFASFLWSCVAGAH